MYESNEQVSLSRLLETMHVLYIIRAVLLLLSVANVFAENPLVKTNVGFVRGLQAKDGNYSMFMGVPYARVNKTNPFGESLPYPHFQTVFQAYDDTGKCPQEEEFNHTIVGDLDCLHVNIYVPNSATQEYKLPVLAFIYGGTFRVGFAGRYLYGPKYLVRHGIILVIMNYRLGPYGFFCAHTPEVPGNQGFKDQVTALKWIHENIDAFGGDPNRITVSGHSFGATSLDFILHSLGENEKIFDKAIIQSPSIYCPDVYHKEPDEQTPLQIADYLGFKTYDVNDALSYIATIDTDKVIAASVNLNTPYGYCIEKQYDNVKNFLTDYTVNLNLTVVKDMSILIGHTERESLFLYDDKTTEYYKKCNIFDDAMFFFDFDDDYRKEMERIIRQSYIGDKRISKQVEEEIIYFTSDYFYINVARRNMMEYIESGADNVYYYVFAYDGGRNFVKNKLNVTGNGATHGDELGYLFDMSFMDRNPTVEDRLMIDRLTRLWTNFVKYGDPNPVPSKLLPVQWKPFSKEEQYYMIIDKELSLQTEPHHSKMAFWDLFYELNKEKLRGYRRCNDTK